AVIDTGIDYTHPDLADSYLPLGYDWYHNDNDPMDDHSHGTHCAGTIAGAISNGIGVAGLANVSIFAEKSFSSSGFGSTADSILAINHAVEQGADILSNSWGGYGYSSLLEETVANVTAAGVMFFAAAGNDAVNLPHYPSAYPGAISIAATDASDDPASFSNYGATIDIAAPGVSILSTVLGSAYGYKSGTSMATPHAAGLAALLWSEFPSYTASEIERLLYQSAVDLGSPGRDDYFGHGRINASDAILGLPEHDLSVGIIGTPTFVPMDSGTTVYGEVTNLGLAPEADVTFSAYINGTLVNSSTIPLLTPGGSTTLAFTLSPDSEGFYNLTCVAELIPGEENEVNNVAQVIVQALYKQIDAQFGDTLAYGPPNAAVPFESKWIIAEAFSEAEVWIDLVAFDPVDKSEYLDDWFLLNLYTRELSWHSSWDLFPYWIDTTDLAIDSVVDLYTSGGAEGVVVESTIFEYYGESIAAWLINDSSSEELLYYDQETGIRLSTCDFSYSPSEVAVFTNVLPGISFHNLRCSLPAKERYILNENHTIEAFVQNTGTHFESTAFSVFLEDSSANLHELNRTVVQLNPGDYFYLDSLWSPTEAGMYMLWAIVSPPSSETYRIDNSCDQIVEAFDMLNYQSFWPDFSWYDAAANGYNLGLLGDDTNASLTLPFNFSFYDRVFDTVYVSSNGWLSFSNPNPTAFTNPQFPSISSSYYYAVAPFWDDLEANNDIFIWENESVVVIEYNNYYHLMGALAGTFQVGFLKTGEIIFQYLSISTDYGATIGLNYGLNPEYYNAHTSRLGGVTNFSLFFTPHAYEWHDIAVNVEAPSAAIVNVSKLIEVTVSNVGTCKEENIEFALYFNGSSNLLKSWTIPHLDEGDDIAISYLWTPTVNGTYNITARTSLRPDEDQPMNNEANSTVTVYNIQEAGFIEVRVYDADSGVPVENAEVHVVLDRTPMQTGFTDANGFYNVTGLDIGFYEVTIIAPAFTSRLGTTQIAWVGDDDYIFFYLTPVVLSPQLVNLADLTYELGSNNSLEWIAVDNNPDLYRLFKD
ncbi:MAG: S8 family serine peptidase, partial [Candidatus Hodarchaeales archaeon]